MEIRGVNYDTGRTLDDFTSRPVFAEDAVRRDMAAIANDLHATAVRISGDDPDRILAAGRHAAAAGLDVWFSPFRLGPDELVRHLTGAAERAEELRRVVDREVVLVLGRERANDGQRAAVAAARRVFGGRITYAAGLREQVDWEQFDIVSVDAYRDAGNAARYAEELRAYHRFGRAVVVTEFGCRTYRGAADRGGPGWTIVTEDRTIPPEYERFEPEQVKYLHELDAAFDAERIAGAFWFTFAGFALPHRPDDPARDLDVASYGLVAVSPDGGWEPKLAFHALAALYGQPAR